MTDRKLSRRQIIAGLSMAGLGGFGGVVAGRGTLARLEDVEPLALSLRSGEIDLVGRWEYDGETRVIDGSTVALPLTIDDDARSGSATLTLSLPTADANPAIVWLRTDCPVPDRSLLAETLDVTIGYCDGATVESGSLREVASALRTGVRLSAGAHDGCLAPGETLCLEVTWSLAEEYAGRESVSWPLTFAAVQCRHDTGTNPFAGVSTDPCPGPKPCECCVRFGKVDVDPRENDDVDTENYLPPGEYAFNEGTDEYVLRVTDSVEKSGTETVAVAFSVEPVGDAPSIRLCQVGLVGSTARATYDRPMLGSPDASTPGLLYGPPKNASPDSPEDYYAISHVTVSVCRAREADGDCPPHLVTR